MERTTARRVYPDEWVDQEELDVEGSGNKLDKGKTKRKLAKSAFTTILERDRY